jgi:hypothetical protein
MDVASDERNAKKTWAKSSKQQSVWVNEFLKRYTT